MTSATTGKFEVITNVEITKDGEMLLRLESGGCPAYQYVYRAARGVYWDQEQHAFKFLGLTDWSYAEWFSHIANITLSDLGLHLTLDESVTWTNVSADVQNSIQRIAT